MNLFDYQPADFREPPPRNGRISLSDQKKPLMFPIFAQLCDNYGI